MPHQGIEENQAREKSVNRNWSSPEWGQSNELSYLESGQSDHMTRMKQALGMEIRNQRPEACNWEGMVWASTVGASKMGSSEPSPASEALRVWVKYIRKQSEWDGISSSRCWKPSGRDDSQETTPAVVQSTRFTSLVVANDACPGGPQLVCDFKRRRSLETRKSSLLGEPRPQRADVSRTSQYLPFSSFRPCWSGGWKDLWFPYIPSPGCRAKLSIHCVCRGLIFPQ